MAANADDGWKKAKSIYEFSAKDVDGNEISLETYRGYVVLIVNVASKCGLTNVSYTQLEALHQRYAESKGLRILAFPCNQFGSQEPGSEAEICEFAKKHDVHFQLFSKVNVNGESAHPLFKYLKNELGGFFGSFIKWNFTKFLVDRDGKPVKRYGPNTEPSTIEKDFEKYCSRIKVVSRLTTFYDDLLLKPVSLNDQEFDPIIRAFLVEIVELDDVLSNK